MTNTQLLNWIEKHKGRIYPAIRSAYGPQLDPDSRLSDGNLVRKAIRTHIAGLTESYERRQAEAGITVAALE